MDRRIGKFNLLLLLGGFLVQQSWAQQRPPYNMNEDFVDYEEEDRFDNHHPLDPHPYPSPAAGARYDDTNREYANSPHSWREEYPEPRIIAPPIPDSEDETIYSEPASYDGSMYSKEETLSSHDRNMYSREEIPEPRIITPPASSSHDRNTYSREEIRDPLIISPPASSSHDRNMYSREEIPEPRIITPPASSSHDRNMYSREEIPEARIIAPPASSSHDRNMYSREEIPEPRIIAPPASSSHDRNMYSREEIPEPRIIAPPASSSHDRNTYSREEIPEPRIITPPSSSSQDRNTYSRDEIPEPRIITPPVAPSHDRNTYSREEIPEPRIITPPVAPSRDRNTYAREEIPEPRIITPSTSSSHDRNTYTREESPEPRIITPPVSPSRDRNTYSREEIPEPRIISPPASPSHDRNTYSREEIPEPRIITPPASASHGTDMYSREDNSEPRVVVPPVTPPRNTYEPYQPYQPREERPVDPRTITPPPRTHQQSQPQSPPQEYPTYQQPRVIVPPTERPTAPPINSRPYPEPLDYNRHMETQLTAERDRAVSQPGTRESHVITVPRLGSVRGYREFKIIKNRPISAYLGLKYGTVRPGIGRFQAASSPQMNPYSDIDATQEPSNCPQFPDLAIITEREARGENVDDCLTLNVYTPAKSGSYPVLVFVHGEMLFDGSAEEGQPDYFLEHDVVLVTINYRLAPFGFLSTLTDDMPGNVALSDIQMSLEWIQQYIRAFNGNPDQVTLLGQAGGATLIHALSLSGKAQGLFHKLILQSGTALNPYFLDEQPLGTLRSFAHYARCPPSRNIEGFTSCFESMKTSDLLNYFKRSFESNEPRGLAFVSAFKLIVGDKLGYLPQHPASMVANNTYPTIVGVTKDAGAFIMTRFYEQLVAVRSRNISDYINVVLKHTSQPRHYQLWKSWALAHIFTPEDIRNPSVQGLVQKLLELVNLILYRAPVVDSIRYTSRSVPTYLYCFDYRGEYHRFGHLRNPLPFEIDATLSDDNIFLFPYPEEVSNLNRADKAMASSIVDMWVSFAQYGMPSYSQSLWPNVSSEYGPFLRFTNSKAGNLELDYHFGDGVPVPNLYPEYFTTTTTSTTTTTTTTTPRPYQPYPQRPNYPQYPNYQSYPSSRNYPQNQRTPNHRAQTGQMNADSSRYSRTRTTW